jgi:hypothetical protein
VGGFDPLVDDLPVDEPSDDPLSDFGVSDEVESLPEPDAPPPAASPDDAAPSRDEEAPSLDEEAPSRDEEAPSPPDAPFSSLARAARADEPRSFFAQPLPLKWTAGATNAFVMVPSAPHSGQNFGPWSLIPWITSVTRRQSEHV